MIMYTKDIFNWKRERNENFLDQNRTMFDWNEQFEIIRFKLTHY